MKKEDVERAIEGIKAIERLLSVFKEPRWTPDQEKDAEAMISLIIAARDFIVENRDEIRAYVIYGDTALVNFKSIGLNSEKMIKSFGEVIKLKTEEEYEEEGEENGCEGGVGDSKPYKVKYRIITEGEESVCIDKDENTLEMLINSLQMEAWDLGDFEVVVLGKERIKHIDDD